MLTTVVMVTQGEAEVKNWMFRFFESSRQGAKLRSRLLCEFMQARTDRVKVKPTVNSTRLCWIHVNGAIDIEKREEKEVMSP